MNRSDSLSQRPWLRNGWYGVGLLAAIVGIELAFPAGSTAQMVALAAVVAFFGSIIAWRSLR